MGCPWGFSHCTRGTILHTWTPFFAKLTGYNSHYKQATIYFSQNSATIAGIILAMDKLDKHLRTTAQDELHPVIQVAMKLAHSKMDRYWKKTDNLNIYCIAMGTLVFYFILF
jgi:hypothetical protein